MRETHRTGTLFPRWLVALYWLLSVSRSAAGQSALPQDETTHRISFHQTVPVAGIRKAELFARSKRWVTYKVGKPKSSGLAQVNTRAATLRIGPLFRWFEVAGRSIDDEPIRQSVQLWFMVTVQVQAERYQYTISELKLEHSGWQEPEPQPLEAFLVKSPTKQLEYEPHIVALMYSLERELTTAISTGVLPEY